MSRVLNIQMPEIEHYNPDDVNEPVGNVTFSPSKLFHPSIIDNIEGPGDEENETINITDTAGLKSGKYSRKTIHGIIKGAKAIGVDPNQAIALALQESGLGTATIKMRRGKMQAPLAMIHDFSEAQQKELDELNKNTGIEPEYLKLGIALRDKLKYARRLGFKDEASQLQAYNGYGVITSEDFGGAEKAYGVPIGSGINLRKNPLYGQRLIALKNDILKNADIQSLLK